MQKFSQTFQYTFTIISVFTIIITSVMDLNASHMTNPLWPPHARFHWAAQYFATLSISVAALYCLWGNYRDKGSCFSLMFIGLSPLLFWGMFIPALLMPGTSTAPDGIVVSSNFPEIFKRVHPNFIISCVISFVAIVLTFKEIKRCQ